MPANTTLKDLVMQTSYEDVVVEYKKLLHSHNLFFYNNREMEFIKGIWEKLRAMEPVLHADKTIWAGRHNVNGLPGGYALGFLPWKDWLGRGIDANLLQSVSHAAIIASCIYEMSYYGPSEEEREKNIEVFDKRSEAEEIEVDDDNVSYTILNDSLESVDMEICTIRNGVAIIKEGTKEIPFKCFAGLKRLRAVVIPDSVETIGRWAFASCYSLTSVVIPNSVKTISNYAFYNCVSLTSIEIPDSVRILGNGAFFECVKFTSIVIPDSVESIGEELLGRCHKLSSIRVSKENKIFDSRENCNAIIATATNTMVAACNKSFIPDTVIAIANGAFASCQYLHDIKIPNSVKAIGANAFAACRNLSSIEIPNSVIRIGESAFRDCFGLKSIEIPDSVVLIESYAFYDCKNLTSICLQENPLRIVDWLAFEFYGGGLPHVDIPDGIKQLSRSQVEGGDTVISIYIPACVSEIAGNPLEKCPDLESIVVDEGNEFYDSRENCNAIIETSTNSLIAGCKTTVIPDTVTEIFDNAFEKQGLSSIVIPKSVTEIGWYAFYECKNLTSVVIPDSVKMIWPCAFDGCCALQTIIVPIGSSDRFKDMLPEELHDKVVEKDI